MAFGRIGMVTGVIDFDEDALTRQALAAVSGGTDPRANEIGRALITHLHALVREIEPTQAEWAAAIEFLTRTGQTCTKTRQEFILLSDTLGVSMLVDAINHRGGTGTATESTVLGPFFGEGRPRLPLGANMSEGVDGVPLYVSGTVRGEDGAPLGGAALDSWHSDDEGFYDVQTRDAPAMRAAFECDAQGRFHFWTVRPRYYPIPDDGPVGEMLKVQGRHPFRPEHVHFMIAAPGHRTLITHIFAEGDQYLDSDVVFGVKSSLVSAYETHPAGPAPDGTVRDTAFLALRQDFVLALE